MSDPQNAREVIARALAVGGVSPFFADIHTKAIVSALDAAGYEIVAKSAPSGRPAPTASEIREGVFDVANKLGIKVKIDPSMPPGMVMVKRGDSAVWITGLGDDTES